jgi:Zn finger protein HypA/HybF involved in hydrogenase expression
LFLNSENIYHIYGKYIRMVDTKRKISKIPKEEFIKVCEEEPTMARAAAKLNVHFNSFKKYALLYDCYKPNHGAKGTKKNIPKRITNIEYYNSRAAVKRKIINENLLEYKCNICGIVEWNNKPLSLHLDHINGSNGDNRLENLRFLCPNCHSQTDNYAGRNK